MKITCIADLHGHQPELIGGDILICAGDYTACDKINQWLDFFAWLEEQKYEKKVVVAGNHDNQLKHGFPRNQEDLESLKEIQNELNMPYFADFLCDSFTEYQGLKIWGTPWTKKFKGINPACSAFTGGDVLLKEKFDLIPDDIDIVVSHSPMYGILDKNKHGEYCGSKDLRAVIERVKPKYHFFGHIHEQGGKHVLLKHVGPNTWCINASLMNGDYEITNKPVDIII